MSINPRVPSAIAGQGEEFATVTAHTPQMITRFFDLYGEFWQRGVVAAEIREMTRLRNARITDCGY